MNKLMTAQEANNLASKNNTDVSFAVAMKWLKLEIEDACSEGEFEYVTDIDTWSVMTNIQGFRVKEELKSLGYKVGGYYEDVRDGFKVSREKKIRISWGDRDESK